MAVSGKPEPVLRSAVRDFLASDSPRVRVIEVPVGDLRERMRQDVLEGLDDPVMPSIPPTYFYDAEGSKLYEQITRLPEYYPTRTEARLLSQIVPCLAEMLEVKELVELGSGSAAKTRVILDAFRAGDRPLTYIPIDISRTMLRRTAENLAQSYPALRVLGLAAPFEDALSLLHPQPDRLLLFLGGTLGNFSPAAQDAFFTALSGAMAPGNHLLLGFDRRAHAGKPEHVIAEAYNDRQGVTARFNANLLARLNRELGADFRLERWRHRAIYNASEHQIEMWLDSQADQTVHLADRSYCFRAGAGILTEISRKFDPEELAAALAIRGLVMRACWMDDRETYGLLLVRRAGEGT
jgi:dimethylhistidine N-methyltransferase